MAKLSRDDVLKLAQLAKLELTEEEITRFRKEISGILDYVEQLQDADVTGLEPTAQVSGIKSAMRPDESKDYGETPQSLLHNAPAQKEGFIKVKRMLR